MLVFVVAFVGIAVTLHAHKTHLCEHFILFMIVTLSESKKNEKEKEEEKKNK